MIKDKRIFRIVLLIRQGIKWFAEIFGDYYYETAHISPSSIRNNDRVAILLPSTDSLLAALYNKMQSFYSRGHHPCTLFANDFYRNMTQNNEGFVSFSKLIKLHCSLTKLYMIIYCQSKSLDSRSFWLSKFLNESKNGRKLFNVPNHILIMKRKPK